jgi:phenylalanyl-tRNA synthetase beta chain
MRFSLNFIKKFLEIDISAERVSQLLTMAGMEVEYLEKKEDDWIFDIEVTSNRYDWLSILGIAREVAACLNKKLNIKYPKVSKKPIFKDREIIIQDTQDCPFYIGRIIKDVKIKDSPSWLKKLVLNCGINSINNVVDITNYCMLKWGNPLHAFDADKIEGNIYIRRAKEGEVFIGIDEKERILNRENLVIADDKKVIALAGVMGAENTEVDQNTKNIFLEGAIFSPVVVRRSKRFAGLDTESSYRFERKVCFEYLEYASAEATFLFEELAYGVFCGYKEAGKRIPKRKKKIILDFNELNAYLGKDIPSRKVNKILINLEFKIEKKSQDKICVYVPFFRFDIQEKVDIYEEIARFYGYQNIPSSIPNLTFHLKKNEDQMFVFKNNLRKYLSLCGLKEIITYSIEAEEEMHKLQEKEFIKILNPLRKQENILRPTLLLGMIKSIRYNLNHNQSQLRFFEIANIYSKKENGDFIEKPFLSLGVSEDKKEFSYLKAVIERMMKYLNLENFEFIEASFSNFSSALEIVKEDKRLGFLGKLDERLKKEFDLKEDLFFAQLDITLLNELKGEKVYKPFSFYPTSWRDISIALRKDKKFKEIEEIVKNIAEKYLNRLEIVDVYEGKDIPRDYSAFTLRIFYQAEDKTLTSQEVDSIHNTIREKIAKTEGVILR